MIDKVKLYSSFRLTTVVVLLITFFLIFPFKSAKALVNYDEGRRMIQGIQLLQDADDPLAYYYLPKFPHLSNKEDGTMELLVIKYVSQDDPKKNGGLFHALIEYSLPDSVLKDLQKELEKQVPGARVAGPVQLQQVSKNGEAGIGRFNVISSILSDTDGEDPPARSVITSGYAPLLPGSKAAIAANLNQQGATLLWESLQGPTSDVSISLSGYYEAKVKGYNAVVTAEVSTIYEHFSQVYNEQEGYTKRQLRKITDEMVQDQLLNIDVFDRSEGLGIKTDDMDAILELITDKLIELMFDAQAGWAAKPEAEVAVENNQIKGRQKRGWFSSVFGGARNEKYVTDNQFVIKKREDIRINKFSLNLSKSSTIKVPIYTSGNLGGLYDALGEDDRYFRIKNLDDPDFQKREVHFQIDGNFAESFNHLINFVTVNFKKSYLGDHDDVTNELIFKKEDFEGGIYSKSIQYPRLGESDADWINYEYRLSWSITGIDSTIQIPDKTNWLSSGDPSILLKPPFEKTTVEIDADRSFFKEAKVMTALVQFYVELNGEKRTQQSIKLRASDSENWQSVVLYHDAQSPIKYDIAWYSRSGVKKEAEKLVEGDYIFMVPPEDE